MKKIKAVLSVLLVAIIAIGGSGCMKNIGFSNSQNKSIRELELLLSEKYGCNFNYSEPYGATMGSNKSQYLFECSDFKNEKILVETIEREDGTMDIYDNFMAYYYENDIRNYINNIAKQNLGEVIVFYNVSTLSLPNSLTKESTIADLLRDNDNSISSVIVAVYDENYKQRADKLINSLKENNVNIDIRLFFVDSIDDISLNNDNFETFAGYTNWYLQKVNFLIDSESNLVYEEWN